MREFLRNQFENRFLWVPFVIAFGAIIYFALPAEPVTPYPLIISIILGGLLILLKPKWFITIPLLFCFGFFYANGFTKLINTPQISHPIRNANITGTVKNIDYMPDKTKIFLSVNSDDINADGNKKSIVRLSIDANKPIPNVGDEINANITIFPPSAPDAPDTFDYAKYSYFRGLTANGYFDEFTIINKSNENHINNLRTFVHTKTNSFLSDSLVLGYSNIVPESDYNIWKTCGVGHIWSISGFHITLVGGWLFFIFFLLFRSIPKITRRIPAKYPALILAFAGLVFYTILSGGAVATMRALLMTGLIFAAFIFSRNVFSLRNVVIAFLIIFLINPYYIMTAGFQLSFAAIFGLVWFFGDKKYEKLSLSKRMLRWVKFAIQTSIIATLFTAPFVAYHFGTFPIYGLIGNLILLPLFSILIMPLVIIGTITALFGFHQLLNYANDIYNFGLHIATHISNMPFANLNTPNVSSIALLIIVIGFLCLMFVKNYNKLKLNLILFFIFIGISIGIIATNKKPLFYSTSDNELVGFVSDGKLLFNKSRDSGHFFAFNT